MAVEAYRRSDLLCAAYWLPMALSAVGFSAMANRLLLVPAPERRRVNHTLVMAARQRGGRDASPTAAIIDSQSVKATEAAGPRRYDAGKKIMGCKRHILTDTEGHLLSAVVHEACIQDRDGAVLLFSQLFWPLPVHQPDFCRWRLRR
jgi:transposase